MRVRVAGLEPDIQQDIARENSLTQEEINAWRKRISGLASEEDSDDSRSTQWMPIATVND